MNKNQQRIKECKTSSNQNEAVDFPSGSDCKQKSPENERLHHSVNKLAKSILYHLFHGKQKDKAKFWIKDVILHLHDETKNQLLRDEN